MKKIRRQAEAFPNRFTLPAEQRSLKPAGSKDCERLQPAALPHQSFQWEYHFPPEIIDGTRLLKRRVPSLLRF